MVNKHPTIEQTYDSKQPSKYWASPQLEDVYKKEAWARSRPNTNYYTSIRQLYEHQTIMQALDTIQASEYHASVRLWYKHEITIQGQDYYTSIRLLYKHQIKLQASDHYAIIR